MSTYEARYASVIDLNPIFTCSLDCMCLAFFAYFRWFKTTWSVVQRWDKIRNVIFALLCSLSSVLFILSACQQTTPFVADLLRPFVVINFFGAMRSNLWEFLKDL